MALEVIMPKAGVDMTKPDYLEEAMQVKSFWKS